MKFSALLLAVFAGFALGPSAFAYQGHCPTGYLPDGNCRSAPTPTPSPVQLMLDWDPATWAAAVQYCARPEHWQAHTYGDVRCDTITGMQSICTSPIPPPRFAAQCERWGVTDVAANRDFREAARQFAQAVYAQPEISKTGLTPLFVDATADTALKTAQTLALSKGCRTQIKAVFDDFRPPPGGIGAFKGSFKVSRHLVLAVSAIGKIRKIHDSSACQTFRHWNDAAGIAAHCKADNVTLEQAVKLGSEVVAKVAKDYSCDISRR